MLTVQDWAEIRRLHFAEGLGKIDNRKRLGIARNTVKESENLVRNARVCTEHLAAEIRGAARRLTKFVMPDLWSKTQRVRVFAPTNKTCPGPRPAPVFFYGAMFWLTWKRLSGSYFLLASTKRS